MSDFDLSVLVFDVNCGAIHPFNIWSFQVTWWAGVNIEGNYLNKKER